MFYLAAITDWLLFIGPAGWALFAIGTVGAATWIYMGAMAVRMYAKRNRMAAEYLEQKARTTGVNVLAPIHQYEKINLTEFFNPYMLPTENARFEDCDLMGPVLIFTDSPSFINCKFFDCEMAILRDDRPIFGIVPFRHCVFLRCRLFRVTLAVNWATYQTLPDQMKQHMKVVTDGRIGDV